MGRSGARPVLAETMLAMLDAGLDPVVPEHGSLGASGDLAPLAHCALALIGEGEVLDSSGERRAASAALAEAGIEPPVLGAKEGLALINGTDGILGMLVLALADLEDLLRVADVAAAASTEALLGTDAPSPPISSRCVRSRGRRSAPPTCGACSIGSAIVASHREDDPRVQDAYSLRCTPQVHGAARDTIAHVESVAANELVAAIDNPMVLPDGRVESCGNFHGAPVAFACDFLAIAAAEVGAIAERRTDRLLDASRSHGLPAVPRPGRRRQLRADDRAVHAGRDGRREPAARGAGARRLAADLARCRRTTSRWAGGRPASCARWSPTCVGSSRSSSPARRRGIELRAPLAPAAGTGAALGALRRVVAGAGPDRWLSPELIAVEALLADGTLLAAVEAAVGALE